MKKVPVRYGNEEVGAFTVSAVQPSGPPAIGITEPTAARISTGVKRSLVWAGIGAAALGTLLVLVDLPPDPWLPCRTSERPSGRL